MEPIFIFLPPEDHNKKKGGFMGENPDKPVKRTVGGVLAESPG
jgi:hypothetical protein